MTDTGLRRRSHAWYVGMLSPHPGQRFVHIAIFEQILGAYWLATGHPGNFGINVVFGCTTLLLLRYLYDTRRDVCAAQSVEELAG